MRNACLLVVIAVALDQAGCSHRAPNVQTPSDTRQKRIAQLIATIDDDPNPLHVEFTQSVLELGEMGPAAIPPVLDLLLSDSALTWLHAMTVLEKCTARMFGYTGEDGWPPGRRDKYLAFMDEMGKLDWPRSSMDDR